MTATDDQLLEPRPTDDWAAGITRALNEQRARARSFFRAQHERLAGLPEVATDGNSAPNEALLRELDELRAGRQQLLDRLEQATADLDQQTDPETDQKHDDLRRRFEMAVEDLREVKARNAELEAELQAADRDPRPAAPERTSVGGLDWESQKEQLMAQLSEFDDDDEDEVQDRLTIEDAMRITDGVVAEKDRLIADLQAQLEAGPGGEPGREPASELLDGDEAIQQERAKLLQLQESWKEKLRKAEIEISVERAKLARERSKMEERIQALEARLAERSDTPGSTDKPAGAKKSSGRKWLSRLGLADDE
jgi:hypothetical protein